MNTNTPLLRSASCTPSENTPSSSPIDKPRISKLSQCFDTSDEEQKIYTFYLDVVLNQNVEMPKIQIPIPVSYTVEHAIELALQQFQRDLMMQCVIIDQQVDDFVPWLAKKSGKCKMDCPVIDKQCILSQINVDTISLQILNKDSVVIDKSRKRKSSLQDEKRLTEISFQKKRKVYEKDEQYTQKPSSTCMYSFC